MGLVLGEGSGQGTQGDSIIRAMGGEMECIPGEQERETGKGPSERKDYL